VIISVPRYLIVGLAAIFSAYHLVLGAASLGAPEHIGPYLVAMVLYAVATVASLWPSKRPRMPVWIASFDVAVAISIPLLVTSQLSLPLGDNYATWYVAAIGTLMVIASTRRRHVFAWVGVGVLTVQTVAWAGAGALTAFGVVGSVVWVAISHVLSRSLARAGRDARQYALAEREAVEWRAAQEAHVSERQFRLGQTSRMALPMLRQIVASGGELTSGQRRECIYLEGAIREMNQEEDPAFQFILYGHTHVAKHEYLTGDLDGRGRIYVNTGTYLPLITLARDGRTFASARQMTMTFAYAEDEDAGGKAGGPSLEAWAGIRRKQYLRK